MLSRLFLRVQRLFGAKFTDMSIDKAADSVGKPSTFFLDVNSPKRFAQGHVPGAKNLAAHGVSAGDLPLDKDATLVFYCANSI
jgi:rhodanese-related sulfurtransferase